MNAVSGAPSGRTLPELVARRARAASDGRLAIDAGAGLLAAAALLHWRPPGWPALLSAAGCVLAYGTWGIMDRELADARAPYSRRQRLLRIARGAAAVAGAAAAVALLLTVMAMLLGTWIS